MEIVDLTEDIAVERMPLHPSRVVIGPYDFPLSDMRCLEPMHYLNDNVLNAFIYTLTGHDGFVDSQVVSLWLEREEKIAPTKAVAPLPRFLVVHESNIHWYLLHLDPGTHEIKAYGSWVVSKRMRDKLGMWLGPAWSRVQSVPNPEATMSGSSGYDCGVYVARVAHDVVHPDHTQPFPRAVLSTDREWMAQVLLQCSTNPATRDMTLERMLASEWY